MSDLPTPISTFLAAHVTKDHDVALSAFGADAVVVDEDRTYRGTDAISGFLDTAGSEFDYTTTLVGCEQVDDHHWVVRNRLEGNFPGGVADLRYRFTLADGLITELVIAP